MVLYILQNLIVLKNQFMVLHIINIAVHMHRMWLDWVTMLLMMLLMVILKHIGILINQLILSQDDFYSPIL